MTSLISCPVVTSMPLLTLMMGSAGGSSSCGGVRASEGFDVTGDCVDSFPVVDSQM